MRYLFLLLAFMSSLCFGDYANSPKYPETTATGGNITLYVDGVAQAPQYSKSDTANAAAIAVSQRSPEKTVVLKYPDVRYQTVWKANPTYSSVSSLSSVVSSSAASISSSRSSASSNGASSCSSAATTAFFQINNGDWVRSNVANVSIGDTVNFAPNPVDGVWSWQGCGITSASRRQTISVTGSCTAIATLNSCSTVTYSVVAGSKSSSASSASSAQRATISWDHPTHRENGEQLLASEIGGYEIRQWSSSSYRSTLVGATTSATLPNAYGKIEIAVFDTDGLYSRFVEAK